MILVIKSIAFCGNEYLQYISTVVDLMQFRRGGRGGINSTLGRPGHFISPGCIQGLVLVCTWFYSCFKIFFSREQQSPLVLILLLKPDQFQWSIFRLCQKDPLSLTLRHQYLFVLSKKTPLFWFEILQSHKYLYLGKKYN